MKKQRNNFKVNNNIQSLDISYLWQELNCCSRPVATSFYAYNHDFLDLYLFWESFLHIYYLDFLPENIYNNFVGFYRKNLSEIFGISLQLKYYDLKNKDYFHELLIANIENNNIPIIPIDMYMMPYSPDYKKDHHIHFIIMKGYDLERSVYYVLDNMQLENGSTKYENFKILFDDIYEMYKCFCEYYLNNNTGCLFLLNKFSDSRNYYQKSLEFFQHIVRNTNIVAKCIEMKVCNLLSKLDDNSFYTSIYLMNMRIVYYNSLIQILKNSNIDINTIKYFEINKQKLLSKWTIAKNKIIYAYEKGDFDLENIKNYIINNINYEINILTYIFKNMLSENINFDNYLDYEICMINNNNAEYFTNNNKIAIKHSNKKRYDTWVMQDDAFQLLISLKNEKDFVCSVRANTDSKDLEDPFHFGLIIRYSDNTKLLFGNESNKLISIYHPLSEDNYDVLMEKHIYPPKYIKIEKNNDKLNFFIKEEEYSLWKYIYTYEYPNKITHVGIFSKTDDFINLITNFDNFKLKINNKNISTSVLIKYLKMNNDKKA